MNVLGLDARRFFLLGMRVFFGVWLLYAGLVKWIQFGPGPFVEMIADMFKETWSPRSLNVVLAWVILITEPLFALWILSGVWARLAWTMTALLMFMLVAGQSILMKPDVVANWQYLVLVTVCAALSDPVSAAGRRAGPGGVMTA